MEGLSIVAAVIAIAGITLWALAYQIDLRHRQ